MAKKSRLLALLLCMTFVFTALAGCGGSQAPAASTPAPAASEPAAGSEPAAAAPPAAEPAELSFQYIGGTIPDADQAVIDATEAFAAANPGSKVNIIYVNWGNAHSQFMNSVMAGMAPDMAMLGGTWCVEFINAGAFAEIDKYVSKDVLDEFIPNGFYAMTGADGVRYGLPFTGATFGGLFYRKDIFEEAGVAEVPKTWDELLAAGEKFKAIGKNTIIMPMAGWEPDDYYLSFIWQAGGDVAKLQDGKWVSELNTEESKKAAQFFYDLTNKYEYMPKTVTGMDWEATKNAFVAGDSAMMLGGMWVINTIKNGNPEIEGKWATAMPFTGPGAQAVLSYPDTMHITAQSKNKELAGKFLDLFYSGEYYEDYCKKTGVMTFRQGFENTEYAQDPLFKPFVEAAYIGHSRPIAPKYEQFRQLFFNPAIQGLVSGSTTPDQFSADMEKAFNDLH